MVQNYYYYFLIGSACYDSLLTQKSKFSLEEFKNKLICACSLVEVWLWYCN